ncbi:hypothetical protein [Rhizobium sp. CF142]|uniref:hypothetical protein n=1 Tax=Rhizobium sp. CF142 TaxID=1144314 RepID=UPI00026F0157|nr:hypothetical protein [Rhizobium sp. CF142]EJJ26257.1 hypothetical protein PMI11_05509 [Rhizobium sp. CF142]
MADQETSCDALARAEIAIEILNQARAIVAPSVYELEDTDAQAAEVLRRRDLIEPQQSIRIAVSDAVEDLIGVWGRQDGGSYRESKLPLLADPGSGAIIVR